MVGCNCKVWKKGNCSNDNEAATGDCVLDFNATRLYSLSEGCFSLSSHYYCCSALSAY